MPDKVIIDSAVEVDGSENTVQLELQGHSTQSEPLQEWQNHDGDTLTQVDANGSLRTGKLEDDPPAPVGAIQATAVNESEDETSPTPRLVGLSSKVTNAEAGELTTAKGIDIVVDEGDGTIDAAYGLRIHDIDAEQGYSIYTGKGPVRVGGTVDAREFPAEPDAPQTGDVRLFAEAASGDLKVKDANGNLKRLNVLRKQQSTDNRLPRRATIWHDEAKIVNGAAIGYYTISNQRYGFHARQMPRNNGDAFTQSFCLKAGTYTLKFLGTAGISRGKIDWYIDGERVVTGQDWYDDTYAPTNGIVVNVPKERTGVEIRGDGYHILKGIVNGKHPDATAYTISLVKIWIVPAAD